MKIVPHKFYALASDELHGPFDTVPQAEAKGQVYAGAEVTAGLFGDMVNKAKGLFGKKKPEAKKPEPGAKDKNGQRALPDWLQRMSKVKRDEYFKAHPDSIYGQMAGQKFEYKSQ